jgi:hypothetical protein
LVQFEKNWNRKFEASGGNLSAMTSPPASKGTKLVGVDLYIVPHNLFKALQLGMVEVMTSNANMDERKGH